MMPPPEPGLSPWSESRKWTALGTRDNRYMIHQRGEWFMLGFSRWDDTGATYGPTKILGARFTSLEEAQQAAADHDKEEW